jgi:hypothetical protein
MRSNKYFFTVSLVLLLGALHVQPLYVQQKVNKQSVCVSECQKKKPCDKKKSPERENADCSQGCNPFVPCAMGSCCYLVESIFYEKTFPIRKQKLPLLDDMTLFNAMSECWHPPEMISWFSINHFRKQLILKNEKSIFKPGGYCLHGFTGLCI